MPRKATDSAEAQSTIDTASVAAAITAGEQIATEDNSIPMQDATVTVAPDADAATTVELAPAVKLAIQALAQIDAALGVLSADNPATATLQAARADAIGALALAEAGAAEDAEKQRQIDAVNALDMPAPVIASMLAAIEAHYAPAPMPAELVAPVAPAPTFGRKQVGLVAQARNAEVAQALTTDNALVARADATIAAWYGSADDAACNAWKLAGTRYAGLVALASGGAGVANRADYVVLSTAIRLRLAATLKAGGQNVISSVWLAAIGPHAVGGLKGNDSLNVSMGGKFALALYADNRFRLAPIGTAGVRFVGADSGAYAAFNGGTASAASQPAAPVAPIAPAAPRVPVAPTVAAAPTGVVMETARCRHCSAKSFVNDAECRACHAADWRAA